MFRKLATSGAATGQLAGSLQPQAALFFFFCFPFFSPQKSLTSFFTHLSSLSIHRVFGALFIFSRLYLDSRSERTHHKHALLHTHTKSQWNAENRHIVAASTHVPWPTCPSVNYAHTHTLTLFCLYCSLSHMALKMKKKREKKKNGKEKLLSVKPHTQSAVR